MDKAGLLRGLGPYPEQKDSGAAWLGEVPAHWEVRRTKTLLRERVEKGFPDEPLLAATQSKGVVRKEAYDNRTVVALKDLHLLKLVRVGDFVVSLRSFQGGIEYAREQGIISPAYTVLFPEPPDIHGFLAWLLKSKPYVQNLSLFVTGIRQGQNIDWEKLSRSELPLPPLPDRTAIVRFLDWAEGRIRRVIRARQRRIKLLEEYKQALIHRAVTGQIDVRTGRPYPAYKPSGVEWLGEVPEHWQMRRAKDLCAAIIDCKNRTPAAVENGTYTVVRTTCVHGGRFEPGGAYKTDEANYKVWTARGAPRGGDVFFTREAPSGEACLVPPREDLCMGQRMMYFRPDPQVLDAKFFLISIYGPLVRGYVEIATNGSTVGHMRLGQVYALPILWCPIGEQRQIADHVHRSSTLIDRAIAADRREIDLLKELRTRLIADVVTGQLDVREAAAKLPDEPMEEEAATEPIDDEESTEDGENGDERDLEAVAEEAEG